VFAFGEFLRRFRSGVPGAPLAAAMPVDRRADLEAELAPVFAQLAQPQREADAVLSRARSEAQQRVTDATAHAGALVERALETADAERTNASAGRIAQTRRAHDALLDAARTEAARIDRAAGERVPAAVAEIAGALLEQQPA
jgi:vacuolar-type H+-ATPase subunit H